MGVVMDSMQNLSSVVGKCVIRSTPKVVVIVSMIPPPRAIRKSRLGVGERAGVNSGERSAVMATVLVRASKYLGVSQIAAQVLHHIAQLYQIEREVKHLRADERQRTRQARSKPLASALHPWLVQQRSRILDSLATAKTLDSSLRCWGALTRFMKDGQLPIANNWVESQIRPLAIGRSNSLFASSLRAGQRAAAAMSLIQSARLDRHDPYADLKKVLTRRPTQKDSQIIELPPHHWQLAQS